MSNDSQVYAKTADSAINRHKERGMTTKTPTEY